MMNDMQHQVFSTHESNLHRTASQFEPDRSDALAALRQMSYQQMLTRLDIFESFAEKDQTKHTQQYLALMVSEQVFELRRRGLRGITVVMMHCDHPQRIPACVANNLLNAIRSARTSIHDTRSEQSQQPSPTPPSSPHVPHSPNSPSAQQMLAKRACMLMRLHATLRCMQQKIQTRKSANLNLSTDDQLVSMSPAAADLAASHANMYPSNEQPNSNKMAQNEPPPNDNTDRAQAEPETRMTEEQLDVLWAQQWLQRHSAKPTEKLASCQQPTEPYSSNSASQGDTCSRLTTHGLAISQQSQTGWQSADNPKSQTGWPFADNQQTGWQQASNQKDTEAQHEPDMQVPPTHVSYSSTVPSADAPAAWTKSSFYSQSSRTSSFFSSFDAPQFTFSYDPDTVLHSQLPLDDVPPANLACSHARPPGEGKPQGGGEEAIPSHARPPGYDKSSCRSWGGSGTFPPSVPMLSGG